MIENLIYFICLAVDLEMIIMASFVLVESVKDKCFREIICWLAILFALMLLTAAYLLFSWPICNYIGK